MTAYTMRRARPGDLDVVMSLIDERIAWLQVRGEQQWSTMEFPPRMEQAIGRGETWLLWDNDHGRAVATATMSTIGPDAFWTSTELATPALYLSKIATRIDARGRGLGRLVVEWANAYGLARGVSTLRWDVWKSNTGLQTYWSSIGARHIRTANVPPWNTGALFEYAYREPSADLLDQVSTDVRTDVLAVVPSRRRDLPTGYDPDQHWDDPAPSHLHVLDQIHVPSLAAEDAGEPEPLTLSASDRSILLYDPGSGWRAHTFFSHPIASWENGPTLRSGHVYQLRHDEQKCRVVVIGDLEL